MNYLKLGQLILSFILWFSIVGCNQVSNPQNANGPIASSTKTSVIIPIPTNTVQATEQVNSFASSTKTSVITPIPTNTVQATEQVNSLPNVVSGEEIFMFSLATSNQVASDDILQEIAFFGGGGNPAMCSGNPRTPTVSAVYLPSNSRIIELQGYKGKNLAATVDITISACGWRSNEVVQVTVYRPDGRTSTTQLTAKKEDNPNTDIWYVSYLYLSDPTDPLGIYSIKFEGISGITEDSFELISPSEPRVYLLSEDNNKILIYNFQPNESIRLFKYNLGEFVAWQEFQADSNGQLLVQLSPDINSSTYLMSTYIAIGDKTGEVAQEGFNPEYRHVFCTPSIQKRSNPEIIDSVALYAKLLNQSTLIGPSTTFPQGVEELHATFEYKNMTPYSQFSRAWLGPEGVEARRSERWPYEEFGESGMRTLPPLFNRSGWPAGEYDLILSVDCEQISINSFIIGD